MAHGIDFAVQTVTSGGSKIWGDEGTGTTFFNDVSAYAVAVIDVKSAGAGVGTVTFDTGQGYTDSLTITAPAIETVQIYGVDNIKVTASVADITVIVKLREAVSK